MAKHNTCMTCGDNIDLGEYKCEDCKKAEQAAQQDDEKQSALPAGTLELLEPPEGRCLSY